MQLYGSIVYRIGFYSIYDVSLPSLDHKETENAGRIEILNRFSPVECLIFSPYWGRKKEIVWPLSVSEMRSGPACGYGKLRCRSQAILHRTVRHPVSNTANYLVDVK